MLGPKRDPTAETAIANVIRQEADARQMTIEQYLAFIADPSDDEDARVSAQRLREMIANL
jgi:hypothetical protein